MPEIAVTLRTTKQVANTIKALENLNCLTREVFSGIMTRVVCLLAKSFTSFRPFPNPSRSREMPGWGCYLNRIGIFFRGVFSRRSQVYYGEVGAPSYKITKRFHNWR